MSDLVVKNLSVALGERSILEGINFSAPAGEVLGLIGPNGAGKSTLGKSICGLMEPSKGEAFWAGQSLTAMPRRKAARTVSYLAQSNEVHWPLNARSAVELGRAPFTNAFGRLSTGDHAAVDRAMQRTGANQFELRDVKRLSGGERSRVLLARALAVEAPVLIADEPIAALDPRQALRIMELLREEANRGTLVIVILHDLAIATRFCDRLLMLKDGKLSADGLPCQVLDSRGLAQNYGVTGHHGHFDAENFVLPWRAV